MISPPNETQLYAEMRFISSFFAEQLSQWNFFQRIEELWERFTINVMCLPAGEAR